ncbi:hypothetical protein BDV93DRAFT_522865 [Ceratobasidium sp. AG-I]|nr:hypothetical protein BDV93DRAFT_522865 [Ceratobasidium sp. AG-I]
MSSGFPAVRFPFDIFSVLPPTFSHTVTEITKYCAAHVKDTSGNYGKSFDWKSFKYAIDRYDGEELVFDKYNNRNISPQESTLDSVTGTYADFLFQTFKPPIQREELTQSLLNTITDLRWAKENGWASFVPAEPGMKTDEPQSFWELRLFIMSPSPQLPSDFCAVLTTIKIGANLKDEADWYNLDRQTSKKFSYLATAMNLVVTKGFRANPSAELK